MAGFFLQLIAHLIRRTDLRFDDMFLGGYMPILNSKLDKKDSVFQQNKSDMLETLDELQGLYDQAAQGGGEEAVSRLRARGKMPIRERIAHVLDRDSPF